MNNEVHECLMVVFSRCLCHFALSVFTSDNAMCVILQKMITNFLKTEVCPHFGQSQQQVSYSYCRCCVV